MAKRENPRPCRESNHGRPVRSLVTVLNELSRLLRLSSMHPRNGKHIYGAFKCAIFITALTYFNRLT